MADTQTTNISLYKIGSTSDPINTHFPAHYNANMEALDQFIGSHDIESIHVTNGRLVVTATDGTTYTSESIGGYYSDVAGSTLVLYVNASSGSDQNDGLTSANAKATISGALAIADGRPKIINVSGTITETIDISGVNAVIISTAGTQNLTLTKTEARSSSKIALRSSGGALSVTASGEWYNTDLSVAGQSSSNKATVILAGSLHASELLIDYGTVSLSGGLELSCSRFHLDHSNLNCAGYQVQLTAANADIDDSTLSNCLTRALSCRGALVSLTSVTHDGTHLFRGTATVNYSGITGSVTTETYNTSIVQ